MLIGSQPRMSWSLNSNSVVSRVRFRISSVLHYGTLPPLVLCLLYSTFALLLFDYCDVVWTPTTAKLTASLERVPSSPILPYRTSKIS